MKIIRWRILIGVVLCALMVMAVALSRDRQLFGHKVFEKNQLQDTVSVASDSVLPQHINSDGVVIINTTSLSEDITGYAGITPLEISIKEGKIVAITALDNDETPGFFNRAMSGLQPSWVGLTVDEALSVNPDAVSGATFSSESIIENVKRGLQYAKAENVVKSGFDFSKVLNFKFIVSLLVVLSACIVPLFVKSKIYRIIQLVLNVAILGFWTGSFISYTFLINMFSNGLNITASSIVFLLMLIAAFVYPVFGKKGHYCSWVCPLGSLQELGSKCVKYKIPLSVQTVKYLTRFRQALWVVLMILMWTGIYFSWIDYELFTAFLFNQASLAVIIIAVVFILLSLFVNRPYCRFVCPTGTLFKFAQYPDNSKLKK